jgi:L-asparaginase
MKAPPTCSKAMRVAASRRRGKGVLVVLNDEINLGARRHKTDALRLQTFRSPTHGLLGIVDRDKVAIFREILQRHTHTSEFDVRTITSLPRVDVVMVYQGATGDVIKALVDLGAKGIVIAGAGAGATSGTQGEGIDYATEKGVFVVTATRTGAGRIAPNRGQGPATLTPAQQRRRAFSISSEDHIPVKARILLMLALSRTSNRDEIQRIFSEY